MDTRIRQILHTGFVVVALILASCQCVLDCQNLNGAVHSTSKAPPCHQHQTPQKQDPVAQACPQSQVFAENRSLAALTPMFTLAAEGPSSGPEVPVLTESRNTPQRLEQPPKALKPLFSVVLRV